jgi:hypothetical protein
MTAKRLSRPRDPVQRSSAAPGCHHWPEEKKQQEENYQRGTMTLKTALTIVLELATPRCLDPGDYAKDHLLHLEALRQQKAIKAVRTLTEAL